MAQVTQRFNLGNVAETCLLVALLSVPITSACAQSAPAQGSPPRSSTPGSKQLPNKVTVVSRGLEHSWGMAFLPDGRILVTERPGRLRIVAKNGTLSAPLTGLPTNIYARGQGGLLDVALDPKFASNRMIYLSFSESDTKGNAGTAVASARLGDGGLENTKVVYRQQPKVRGGGHYGSRIIFRKDGTMFITQGDRMDYREQAQDMASLLGKVVRINSDGSIPKDNPFINRKGVRPEIWSYGHRNIQSALVHPGTGQLWAVEHGPRGGDELNLTEAGKNYGWPVISYGVEYSGRKIGEGLREKAGMVQPVYYWDPVIAPSGMAYYSGNAYPGWKGNFFVGALSPGSIVRLEMNSGKVATEERFLGNLNARIRDIEQGPDGLLYMLTDESDGRLIRLERAGK